MHGALEEKAATARYGVAHDSATRRRASHAGVPGGKHPQPPQRQSAEAKVVTLRTLLLCSPLQICTALMPQPASLLQEAQRLNSTICFIAIVVMEVAIDILPGDTEAGVKTEGMKTQAEGIRKIGSFSQMQKSTIQNASTNSAYLFHSQRDTAKLILKEIECPLPNPHLLSLVDDEVFSLEPRVKILEEEEIRQMKLHRHKVLLDIQRAQATRKSLGSEAKDGTSDIEHLRSVFPEYLWSKQQAEATTRSTELSHIPGKLMRSRLRFQTK